MSEERPPHGKVLFGVKPMTRDPIDAQARRLRLLKRKLAADYAAFDAVYKSITGMHTGDFMNKGDKGRRRIFDRINAAVIRCGARLESLRLEAMQETQWRAMSLYAKFLMRKEEEDAARS